MKRQKSYIDSNTALWFLRIKIPNHVFFFLKLFPKAFADMYNLQIPF